MTLTADQAQSIVRRLYERLAKRRKVAEALDAYYRGKQPLKFASEQWRDFHGNRYRDFADNWCAPVANSPSERLRITGFRLPSEEERAGQARTDDEKLLWDAWLRNDLEQQSSQGFLGSLVAKRSYVIVWGDEDDEPQVTWEDATQVIVEHDPENPRRGRYALKAWRDDKTEYATLYTADEVFKFQRETSGVTVSASGPGAVSESGLYLPASLLNASTPDGWKPREITDELWPLPNPMKRLPVVEFANRPLLRGEPLSEVDGTAAMQDAINLLWAYLFGAADAASFPHRVIMGQDLPQIPVLDDNGQMIGTRQVPLDQLEKNRFLWLTGDKTKIGEFNQVSLAVFTDTIEVAVGHIAAQTRTPPHYLATKQGLHNLTGDALKAAETGLVKKVEEQQLFFSPDTREVFHLMALAKGNEKLAEAARIGVPLWKDAEIRSEAQLMDVLQKAKAIGFPFRYLAEKWGLSPAEIDRLMDMKRVEAAMDPLAAMTGLVVDDPTQQQDDQQAADAAEA